MSQWCNKCNKIPYDSDCNHNCPVFGLEFEELAKKYLETISELKYLKDCVENPCIKCSLNYDGSCCGCDKGREYKKIMEETK